MSDRAENINPAFRAGRVLTSMNLLDTIAVVDLESGEVVWARKGKYKRQHDPKILENGHLMLFDNVGRPGTSRVIEFDLKTMKSCWVFAGRKNRPFQSNSCGAAQRLPNGNTLITESDGGRALEVNESGDIVWEFYNPHRAGENNQFIATLFEMVRLPPDFNMDWASQ